MTICMYIDRNIKHPAEKVRTKIESKKFINIYLFLP